MGIPSSQSGRSHNELDFAQRRRPLRVVSAVILLSVALITSGTALFVNQLVFHGSGIGPGLSLGLATLVIQAVIIWLVARGSQVGRALVLVFLVLATLPLGMVSRLMAEGSIVSAAYTVVGFLLKAIAAVLLFTGDSRRWFAVPRSAAK